jgi:hypothetical protein
VRVQGSELRVEHLSHLDDDALVCRDQEPVV